MDLTPYVTKRETIERVEVVCPYNETDTINALKHALHADGYRVVSHSALVRKGKGLGMRITAERLI